MGKVVTLSGVLRKYFVFAAAVFMLVSIGAKAYASDDEWTGNANWFIGIKALDETEWSPTEAQAELGLEFDFRKRSWPVNIAVDYMRGKGDGVALGIYFESETSELNLGIRKIFDTIPYTRFFLGGGLAMINGKFSGLGLSDDDTALGTWLNGGVYWTIAEHLNLGLELKFSSASVNIFGVDANAGGTHFGFLAGYHW